MAQSERELYCILLPLGSGKLLLPRSLVEEVRGMPRIVPVDDSPPWLLGKVRWRREHIPLIAIEPLLGAEVPEHSRRSRMIIMRAPQDALQPAAVGILAQGFPYILRVTPELLEQAGERAEDEPREGLLAELSLGLERPVVPDLPALAEEAGRLLAA